MKYLLIILLFITVRLHATNYTHPSSSGDISVTGTSLGVLVAGDTVFCVGTFGELALTAITGASGNNIVIDLRGATFTSPSTYHQPRWADLHYVKVLGGLYSNWNGTIFYSCLINNLIQEGTVWRNPSGSYKSQPCWQWDDAFASTSMVFTGSLSQTFYNNTYYLCEVNGFVNVTPVAIGTVWNGSGGTDNRSIFNNGLIDSCIFRNCTNTSGTGMNVIFGTGFNMEVKRCRFDTIASTTVGGGGAHIAAVLWYGSISVHNNRSSMMYAALARLTPLAWNGLPGYIGNGTSSKVHNNTVRDQESYSAFEFNQNNLGNRTTGNGIFPTKWYCESNTVFGTVRHSYNGDYFGFIVDVVNADSGTIINNLMMKPEKDFTYDSATRGYVWAQISGAPSQQTVSNNRVYPAWLNTIVTDTVGYVPPAASPLVGQGIASSFRTTDLNGTTVGSPPDIGAVEYTAPSGGSPPACTTNLTPANLSTTALPTSVTLTWNVSSGATGYNVFLNAVNIGSTSGTSYPLTGLSAATLYVFYIQPTNSFGAASGCSSSSTAFTTASYTYSELKIYRRGQ